MELEYHHLQSSGMTRSWRGVVTHLMKREMTKLTNVSSNDRMEHHLEPSPGG